MKKDQLQHIIPTATGIIAGERFQAQYKFGKEDCLQLAIIKNNNLNGVNLIITGLSYQQKKKSM